MAPNHINFKTGLQIKMAVLDQNFVFLMQVISIKQW